VKYLYGIAAELIWWGTFLSVATNPYLGKGMIPRFPRSGVSLALPNYLVYGLGQEMTQASRDIPYQTRVQKSSLSKCFTASCCQLDYLSFQHPAVKYL